jgi:hypothetical protein
MMEQWNDLIGKDLKIIFEDGENHYSNKTGTLIGVTETHLFLRTEYKKEGVLLSKIIRFEVMK